MNRDSLAKDKFYSYSHKQHSISKRTNRLQQVKQLTKPTLESGIIITVCLSSCEDCNGRYEDNTGQFKIQCHCNCHSSHDSLLEENEKHACLGSSQNRQEIDDFQLIDQAKVEIAHINNRLANRKLVLSVKQKQTQLTAVWEEL